MRRRIREPQFRSWLSVWRPFGLWRIDWYYIRIFLRIFFLIVMALAALVAIGDIFQRFDDFVIYSRRAEVDLLPTARLFVDYYACWVPQLIFQYMFPITMLLAASIAATSSYSGPRGNNEYIVIRSAGVPVLRAFFPLLIPALLIGILFQATRDHFLPDMVRRSNAIINQVKFRTSNPTSIIHQGAHGIQTAAIGWFAPDGVAHNLILEVRDPVKFNRGDTSKGDNDFVAYRAAEAKLERLPNGNYQWRPLKTAELHTYTLFSRRSEPWTRPVPTEITPAMIERQPLGDAVSSWRDLLLMSSDNAGAEFEMHWRLSDPLACCLLIVWGSGLCMARMLRGKGANYIQAITWSMVAAAMFYILRLAGKSLWESGHILPAEAVWLPLAAAALVALPIAFLMEP